MDSLGGFLIIIVVMTGAVKPASSPTNLQKIK